MWVKRTSEDGLQKFGIFSINRPEIRTSGIFFFKLREANPFTIFCPLASVLIGFHGMYCRVIWEQHRYSTLYLRIIPKWCSCCANMGLESIHSLHFRMRYALGGSNLLMLISTAGDGFGLRYRHGFLYYAEFFHQFRLGLWSLDWNIVKLGWRSVPGTEIHP